MNKVYILQILFIALLILFIAGCKSNKLNNQEIIDIDQLTTDYPVSLRRDTNDNQIFRINFRIPFIFISNVSDDTYITSIDYYYSDEYGKSYLTIIDAGWSSSLLLYNSMNNQRILRSKDMADRKFNNENPAYIYIYTMHSLDTTTQVQLELKPYLDKMIELNQDTLSIPSFNEFKKEHPQLVKDLLQGDSISILIKKDLTKNPQLLGDTIIKVAIKY